jgi:glycosyltransferase involved in cell wall biosynthesis
MEKIKTDIRILHAAALLSPSSGMCTQMAWELEAAEKLGIEWQVKMYCPKNSPDGYRVMHFDNSIDSKNLKNPFLKFFYWIKLRFNYHHWLTQQEDDVDIYILRYYVHDPFQYFFAKRCKKPIYFVHHTLEVPELQLAGGMAGWIRASLENFIGKKTLQLSKGVIGVTKEIVDYEMSRINTPKKINYVYPNGILYKQPTPKDRRGDTPELLFVANFSPWHGLDRVLHAIKKSDENFVLHLVGKVPNELKDQITDPRVKLHGHLNQNQIVELSEQCWIGLASFALDRNKMKQACPLKSREYLMLGLPVYGDYQDVFPDNFIYYKKDKDNISSILNFCHQVRDCSKNDISVNSYPFIDKKILLSDIYKKFKFYG